MLCMRPLIVNETLPALIFSPFPFPSKSAHEGMKNVRMGGMYRARMRARALVLAVRALSLSLSLLLILTNSL